MGGSPRVSPPGAGGSPWPSRARFFEPVFPFSRRSAMPKRLHALLLTLSLLAVFSPTSGWAQRQARDAATLVVTVTDQSTGSPIDGATVRVSGVTGSATTDAEGRARLPGIGPGARMLSVRRIGYGMAQALVEFETGATLEAEVTLRPEAVELEGVRVTSWGRRTTLVRNGFYDRQKAGMGTYLVREQIESMRPMHLTDVFRRVRGFRVLPKPRGGGYFVASSRGVASISTSNQLCLPLVFLDGVQMGQDALDFVPWSDVEAIESYAGPASIPAQYNPSGSACGAILIWTR